MTNIDAKLSLSEDFGMPAEAEWLALVEKMLKGADFEKRLVSQTMDGIRLQPLYQQMADAGPIGRGAPATRWRLAQRVDHPDVTAANELALADLEQGADTLVLVTPDSASARGFGIVLEDADALDRALVNVSLEMISLRVEPSSSGRRNAALVAALV
ncbi:MAG TPA: methylmalonyl-CoA mutase, partial [Hyphomicrobiaceae bacterium]|nr:methylmalonyl-CoA mutase [Hyphomicrobiaceae bacterium]